MRRCGQLDTADQCNDDQQNLQKWSIYIPSPHCNCNETFYQPINMFIKIFFFFLALIGSWLKNWNTCRLRIIWEIWENYVEASFTACLFVFEKLALNHKHMLIFKVAWDAYPQTGSRMCLTKHDHRRYDKTKVGIYIHVSSLNIHQGQYCFDSEWLKMQVLWFWWRWLLTISMYDDPDLPSACLLLTLSV